MTNRSAFLGGNAEAQQGPLLLKQVAYGKGKTITMYQSSPTSWHVRTPDWVQYCGSLAHAEAEFGRLIGHYVKEIALHALGVADDPADG